MGKFPRRCRTQLQNATYARDRRRSGSRQASDLSDGLDGIRVAGADGRPAPEIATAEQYRAAPITNRPAESGASPTISTGSISRDALFRPLS